MSIDQRLRNGLHPAGSDPGPDTLAALRLVEERARRRARTTRLVGGALVAAVVLLVVGVGVGLQQGGSDRETVVATQPTDQGLQGTYVVDVGSSRVGREQGLVGRWIVTLAANGVLELRPPPGYAGPTTGAAYRVQGDRLRTDALFDPGCQAINGYVGTYTWSLAGDVLTFTVVDDDCSARQILFTEQAWDRVP